MTQMMDPTYVGPSDLGPFHSDDVNEPEEEGTHSPTLDRIQHAKKRETDRKLCAETEE